MTDKLLTRTEVESRLQLRKSAVYRLMRDPDSGFPLPVKISARAIRWRQSEVEAWLADLPRATGQTAEA